MELRLSDRHALVCGSTQGIGRATAMELARAGARITLLSRDPVKLNDVLATLDRSVGQQHSALAVDMGDTTSLATAIDAHLRQLGPVDILVNNTGGPLPGRAYESEPEQFAAAFRQHLMAFQTMVRAVAPAMMERRHGRIINIISTSVKQPLPDLGVSNTIRGAVANWGKTLAGELGPHGITVNNVLPGSTDTERLRAIIQRKAEKKGVDYAEAEREMMNEVPARRFARPEEVAYAVLYLASDAAAYVNGINLPVDGGRTGSL